MKVTFIGHASILVEAGGVTVLSDPWWRGPCFGAQWWTYPSPFLSAVEGPIDYIYISHGHHDHLHPSTLATLPKTAKVLTSSKIDVAPTIREMGFEIIEIGPDEVAALGTRGMTVRIVPTHGDDTLMVLSDGREVCANLNDALHSAPGPVQTQFIKRLHSLYPKMDYVFCGYGVASHFPNCYVIPGKDAAATAAKRQAYFNDQWVKIIAGISPRYGFPFAADVVFLQDELFWANEATHNPQRPTAVFEARYPRSSVEVIDIAPGFEITDGKVTSRMTRQPLQAGRLREDMREQVMRANRVGQDSEATITEIVQSFRSNLSNCHAYLSSFPGDYRVMLRFQKSPQCLVLEKKGANLTVQLLPAVQAGEVDMVYTTRWAYLKWALQRVHGDELLFVGSGGIFEYASKEQAARAIHQELITLIRNRPRAARPRVVNERSPVYRAKTLVKRMLGRADRDLYDLMDWTEFDDRRTA